MALVGVELSPEMRQIDLEYVNVRDFMANLMTLPVSLKSRHAMTCYHMLWNLAVQRILRGCSPGLYEIQLDGVKGLAYFDPHPGNYELLGIWRDAELAERSGTEGYSKRFEKNIRCNCNRFVYHIIYTYTMISGKINKTIQLFDTEFKPGFCPRLAGVFRYAQTQHLVVFMAGGWIDAVVHSHLGMIVSTKLRRGWTVVIAGG